MPQPNRAQSQPTIRPLTLPPLIFVVQSVLSRTCKLSPAARIVAAAVADRMNTKPESDGRHVAFMGERDIAGRTGLSIRTIRIKLRELREAPEPLFAMQLGGVTRGKPHRCYRFEMIADVAAFVAARNLARAKKRADKGTSMTQLKLASPAPAISLETRAALAAMKGAADARDASVIDDSTYATLVGLMKAIRDDVPLKSVDPHVVAQLEWIVGNIEREFTETTFVARCKNVVARTTP